MKVFSLLFAFVLTLSLLSLHQNSYAQLRVEAEQYKSMKGIQTEITEDIGGGINAGWIDGSDWMDYEVEIPIDGSYIISYRYASLNITGNLEIQVNGETKTSKSLSPTGGWQNWKTISTNEIGLTKGIQTIRLLAKTGGFNLNWFEIKLITPIDDIAPTIPVIIAQKTEIRSIQLSWEASTDQGSAVAGYRLFNNNELFAVSNQTSIELKNLIPATLYKLAIVAVDFAGNYSDSLQLELTTATPDWKLIWSDEFDGTKVDSEKWNFRVGPNNANNEEQYYTNGENTTVADGLMTIEARLESRGGYKYTSAQLNSRTKGDWVYGRIDVRAKMPAGKGTWPAIWMMPTNSVYGGWPNSGEIDILEHVGNNLGWAFGTVHTGAYNHKIGTQKGGGMTINDIHLNFHEYSIEWYPDRIDFYFDNIHYFTFDNDYKTSMEWPYDQPFYLILNIAMGGDLGGAVNQSSLPQKMVFDYVRVYDLKLGEGDTIAPFLPEGIDAEAEGTSIELKWKRASDNEYIEKYYIFQNDVLIDSVGNTNYLAAYLDPLTEYKFSIQAADFAGNLSNKISQSIATTELHSYPVPGKIQAEDFIYMNGVDTEKSTDKGGGVNVGWIDNGDWMEYSINVADTGTYYLAARVASETSTGKLALFDENESQLTSVETPRTGGWQSWKTVVSEPFLLNSGVQRIKLLATKGGFNLNWFNVTNNPSGGVTGVDQMQNNGIEIYPNPIVNNTLNIENLEKGTDVQVRIINIEGKLCFNQSFQNNDGKIQLEKLKLNKGMHIIQIVNRSNTISQKLIVN